MIWGFYEEEYPYYSEKWESEIQAPVTAQELNDLVARLKNAEQQLKQISEIVGECRTISGEIYPIPVVDRVRYLDHAAAAEAGLVDELTRKLKEARERVARFWGNP